MIYESISITELKKHNNKNIYCFGAGRAFDSFMLEYARFRLENDIKAVVDNNADVLDISAKIVNGISIPIISIDRMLSCIGDNDYILITAAAYEEIIDQLEKIEKLKSVKFIISLMLRIVQDDYDRINVKKPSRLSLYQEIRIPKVIHYCWFGRAKIPAQYREWMESWKKYCPDYEIIEWNEDNYDIHKNRYIEQAYDLKKWAFVSDYARIDIINKYGGVYLDTDVELLKNIDVLLKNDAFCGFQSYKYVAYGLGFGAGKQNQILSEIKEYYDAMDFVSENGTLNQITCPVIQTEVMKKHGLVCNGEFQVVDGMTVYPSCVLCGMSPHSFKVDRECKDTYAIHHFAASWVEDKSGKNNVISALKKWGRD